MLTIYEPHYEDLWFKQQMMADARTMSYNHAYGGTIPFPQDAWKEWYNRWIVNSQGKRYYRYLMNDENDFIGEISYHYDTERNCFMADLVIYSIYRRRGFGGQALEMLCSIAKEHGISVLYDEIAIDNPAVRLFINHGFSEEFRTKETILLRKTLGTGNSVFFSVPTVF